MTDEKEVSPELEGTWRNHDMPGLIPKDKPKSKAKSKAKPKSTTEVSLFHFCASVIIGCKRPVEPIDNRHRAKLLFTDYVLIVDGCMSGDFKGLHYGELHEKMCQGSRDQAIKIYNLDPALVQDSIVIIRGIDNLGLIERTNET